MVLVPTVSALGFNVGTTVEGIWLGVNEGEIVGMKEGDVVGEDEGDEVVVGQREGAEDVGLIEGINVIGLAVGE